MKKLAGLIPEDANLFFRYSYFSASILIVTLQLLISASNDFLNVENAEIKVSSVSSFPLRYCNVTEEYFIDYEVYKKKKHHDKI